MQRSRYRLKLGLLLVAVLLAVSVLGIGIIKPHIAHAQTTVLNPQALTAGKALLRANTFLEWSFKLYKDTGGGFEDIASNTLYDLWRTSFKGSLAVYLVFGIVIAFGFILKTQWIIKWRRFIPWFFISIVGSAVSYLVLKLIMSWTALFMSQFLGSMEITDIIKIAGDYNAGTLGGLTNADVQYLEVVNNTITLVKITTATVYAIGIALLLRIIVLWMLTVVAPFVFPFVAFPVTQSIGKIWAREFARWLIAGPLIALLLYASSQVIAKFPVSHGGQSYEGATQINLNNTTGNTTTTTPSIKTQETDLTTTGIDSNTYARYILSLVLLWVSITLPWLLMRFAINHIESTSSKWYEKNREGAIFKQLANTFSRAGGGSAKTEEEKQPDIAKFFAAKQLNLPAREMHITPVVGQRGNAFSTSTTAELNQPISAPGALKLAGLTHLGETVEKIKTERGQGRPLLALTELEQKPAATINNITNDIDQLQDPNKIKDPVAKQRINDLKNNLTINESRAGLEAKGIIATARQDTKNIANQNLKSELRVKTLETVKENISRITSTQKISEERTQALQQVNNLINQYQNTPQSKQADRQELGKEIEVLAKAIVAENRKDQEQYPTRREKGQPAVPGAAKEGKEEPERKEGSDNFTIPSGGLSATKLPQSDNPEKQLLDSLEFLGSALSYTSDEDIGKVFEEKPEVAAKLADQSGRKDYEETQKQWVEYYRNTAIPTSATIKTRADWLKAQIALHQELLAKATSKDYDERREGIETLNKQAPFLLLGNYSILEITTYLQAKIDAAQTVLGEQKDTSDSTPTSADGGMVNNDSANPQIEPRSQDEPPASIS